MAVRIRRRERTVCHLDAFKTEPLKELSTWWELSRVSCVISACGGRKRTRRRQPGRFWMQMPWHDPLKQSLRRRSHPHQRRLRASCRGRFRGHGRKGCFPFEVVHLDDSPGSYADSDRTKEGLGVSMSCVPCYESTTMLPKRSRPLHQSEHPV